MESETCWSTVRRSLDRDGKRSLIAAGESEKR